MQRWRGRTALVTGASAGIGFAIAEALARNGMKVIGCARNTEKILELGKKYDNGPGSVVAMHCDVGKAEQIEAMFQKIEKEHKHVDVLINNAGILHPEPLLSGSTEKWRQMLEIDVLGLSICARETIRLMQKNGTMDGTIINIGSYVGHFPVSVMGPIAHFYAGIKAMVVSLTESLHREARAMQPRNNIRITDISPGTVATEAVKRALGDAAGSDAHASGASSYEKLSPTDIADSVLFVLSAPPHVNIKTLLVSPTQELTL